MWRLIAALASLVLLTAACGDGGDPAADDTTTTEPPPTTVATRTCTNEGDGLRVAYPEDWHTNDTETLEPCRFFHPEPFEVDPGTEATGLAVTLGFTETPFDELTGQVLEEPHGEVVTDDERLTVAGEEALRVETESTGEALLPEGALAVQYFVDFDGRTLTAATLSVADDVSFERSTEVLDLMMRSLERVEPTGDAAACSAADMDAEPEEQPELPDPVAEMRAAIVEAAVACDYARLEELALGGEGSFTYSFGAEGDPAGYWRGLEEDEQGPAPLRYLVGLLDRPHSFVEHADAGVAEYVWPSAFAYDSWDAVPEEEREALRPLYGDEDFESFRRFGGYIGYRVGITPEGDWVFFVAGD